MYAQTGIFEFERGGHTILKAKGMSSVDAERAVAKFKDANGNPHSLIGGPELSEFDVECRDVSEFLWFWGWYNTPNPEAIDFAIHGKNQAKTILYSIDFEDVKPRGLSVGGFDTENDAIPQTFTFKLIGKLVEVS